jgi:CheY-like chemotaxis protein
MPQHILVVDDDSDICYVLQDRLESYGYSVEVAMDGRAALLSINQALPRGVILTIGRALNVYRHSTRPLRKSVH